MSEDHHAHLRDVFPGDSSEVLLNADRVGLFQLHLKWVSGGDTFHGFPLVARLPVVEDGRRATLLAGLAAAIKRGAVPARCFIPHHGVRVERGGRPVELILCFACSRVLVACPAGDKPPLETTVSSAPRELIDWLFLEAGHRLHDLDDGECEYCGRPTMEDTGAAPAVAPPIFDRLPTPTAAAAVRIVTRRCRRCGATDLVPRPESLDVPSTRPRAES